MVNRDFSDLFAAFNEAGVKYLLVGAHAVAFHAEPRYTKDLHVWVEATVENAARVHTALRAFGAPMSGVSEADFAEPGITLQLGVAPNRIESLRPSTACNSMPPRRTGRRRVTASSGSR